MPVEKTNHKKNSRQNRLTLGFLLASLNTGASRALWPGLLDTAEHSDVNLVSFPGGRLSAATAFESQRNQIYSLANPECLDGLVTWASSLGGVLSPRETSAFHQRYHGMPMVSLAQFMEGLPAVALDSYKGMRLVLRHLIEDHGYQRLAFIRGPEEHYYAQERYRAYLDALEAYHLPLINELITRPLRWESGAEATQILLDERGLTPGKDFQAVVAVSDMLALWVQKTLQARGFDVPGDVAVTGFNNSVEERMATPPLTTVDLPFYDQGARAVEMLLMQVEGKSVPALITLSPSLVIRQSCGCLSAAVRDAGSLPDGSEINLDDPACRERCLHEMSSAAGSSYRNADGAMNGLLDGLLLDLRQQKQETLSSGSFMLRLSEALNRAMLGRQDINLWNDVVSVIRHYTIGSIPTSERLALETLFGQARVMIGEANQRSHSYWQWRVERQADLLRETNRALLTTFDVHQLGDVLYEHLPGLGIPSAYLVLYEEPNNPSKFSRLMMAYTDSGRAVIEATGKRFPTRELLPHEYLPEERRYSLVVEPLYFQEKLLGYALFENGPKDGDIYELLRGNLSSALQGANLFDEIQQARLTAEKADRIKTRLLANVSHELRTPLHIILGYTQNLLQNRSVDQSVRGDIQGIQDHAEHQLRVINDLLDLSRAEIDELDLALDLLDPIPLLHEAFHVIADQSNNPEVQWQLEVAERLPLIHADAVRLRQILLNLLSNARKFTESGFVKLGAELAHPYVHFWVSDTGSGISPEEQERIFEPFVSIEGDKHISGGIGLGLSITRHLVTLHGGKMNLDSEIGKGSTFHFYIPLPALDHSLSYREDAQPVLLLISSSDRVGNEIQSLCQRQNLQIARAANMSELEIVLSNTQPQVIAWDLMDARPGDWNIVRRLRHHPVLSQAPFILFGQEPGDDSGTSSLALGLTSYVSKHPDQKTLFEAINALCPPDSSGTILIVDDDAEVRETLQMLIEKGLPGCSIRKAEDGERAITLMEEEIPSLVLLDMVMPGMSGADVLDHMRASPQLCQVPVIVLSNKSLSLEDVKRLETHARVIFQSKGMWTEAETMVALNRALFGADTLPPYTSALVKRVVAYFHQNYSRPLSRWEIAQAIGVSEDYLSKVFNRELGISPWDYLNRYRILQAQSILRTTTQSIGAIARAVGFNDQAYFSRVFRKRNGISPQEYREMRIDMRESSRE